MTIQRVGFIGMGMMGAPMARNLAKKGFEVHVWNRNRAKAEALAADGVRVEASAADVVKNSDAFCTCLTDPKAMEEVCLGDGGVLSVAPKGQLFIDFSTGSVALAKKLEAAATARGVDFTDSPVTGSVPGAEKGTLLIMSGASNTTFQRAQPIFAAVGEKTVHCGAVGAGSQVKVACNALIGAMLESFSEGLLLTSKAGVNPRRFFEVVQAAGFQSPYYEFKGKQLLEGGSPPVTFTIDLMHKDLGLMIENAAAHRVPVPVATGVRSAYDVARAVGKGSEDISSVISAFEMLCGLRISDAAKLP